MVDNYNNLKFSIPAVSAANKFKG